MFNTIISLLSNFLGVGEKYIEGRNKIRKAKINAEIAKWSAKAKAYENEAKHTNNWEIEALKQSQYSWKDEFWTIIFGFLLLFPMVLSTLGVITGNTIYIEIIKAMWDSYSSMPLIFQGMYPFIVLASMGIRYKSKKDSVLQKDK